MPADRADDLLERCSRLVEERAGLHLPRERWPDLLRALRGAAADLGCNDADEVARRVIALDEDAPAFDALIARLTVGETYFFRDPHAFEALEQLVLPELISARGGSSRRIRVWSAGCCSGEEPYSIAMTLSRVLPDFESWRVTVLGTDINPAFLAKAEAARYTRWSFRACNPDLQKQFFRSVDANCFEVVPRIRKLVTFERVNLVEDVYPALLNGTNAMDIVFCRNVLMYFSREQARKVVENLDRSLVRDGWLFPAGAEASRELFKGFTSVNAPHTVVYRKGTATEPANVPVNAPPPAKAAAKGRRATEPPAPPPAAPPTADARQLANQGRLEEALAACDEALRADKLSPAHHYLRGLILQERGAQSEATAALRRALYLDPDFILAHFALGNTQRRAGRAKEAARTFEYTRTLLRRCHADAVLPESDGMTAGRLLVILEEEA